MAEITYTPEHAKKVALARLDLVKQWEEFRRKSNVKLQADYDFVKMYNSEKGHLFNILGKISRGSLHRWKTMLNGTDDYTRLIPQYRYSSVNEFRSTLTEEEMKIFMSLLLHPNRICINLFEFDSKDEQFITYILNNTIKQIKLAQKNLLKCKFKYIALKNFSSIKQEELGCKTLDEFINSKIHKFLETVENIPFKGKDNNLLKKTFWNVYEKTFSKRKILSGGYSYLFAGEPNKDFYSRLFSFIVENCQKIDDIKNIPSNIENYKILSNFDYKRNFENFGFNKNNIKVK